MAIPFIPRLAEPSDARFYHDAQFAAGSRGAEEAALEAETKGNIKISKAVIPVETMSGTVSSVKRGGRRVAFKGADGKVKKTRVSGRNTIIMVAGKKAKRSALKEGLKCKLTFQASAATKIECM